MAILKRQNGFTLIEVILVLAISGALLAIAYAGQGELRSRARFTDAVERTKSALSQVQTESNATVNTDPLGGSRPSIIYWGNRVQFTNDSATVAVTRLKTDEVASVISFADSNPSYTFNIPWGVKFYDACTASCTNTVFYLRDFSTARGKVFVPPSNWSIPPSSTHLNDFLQPNLYDPTLQVNTTWSICLTDDRNHKALIKIKTPSGDVSTVYNTC